MPSEQARLPFWLCTCALLIFLGAAGSSPLLDAGPPANLDCGKDVGRFVKAFDQRTPATVRQVTSISMSGLTNTIGTYWETRAFTGDKCTLYVRIESEKCSVDEAAIRQTQASMGLNVSKEVQETALKEAVKEFETTVTQINEEAAHYVGHDETCVIQTVRLKALIARWQKGELIEDWSKQAENCQGSLVGKDRDVSLASSVQVSVPPPSAPAPEAPPPPSETQVTANYYEGPAVQFKPEEKRAFLFMAAIVEVEKVCAPDFMQPPCTLDQMVKGYRPKDSATLIGLSQDPRQEKDYEYGVTIAGDYANHWTAQAIPRRAGRGGFFFDKWGPATHAGVMGMKFNPAGPATTNDKVIIGWGILGPSFVRHN